MPNIDSLRFFLPELIIIGSIVTIVLVDVFYRGLRLNRLIWALCLAALAATAVALAVQPIAGQSVFMGSLAIDSFSKFFKWLFLIATAAVYLVSPRTAALEKSPRHEYYLFLLAVLLGLFLMASAADLIIVYLSIEIVSIGSFILAGFLKEDRLSNESALKYVIYGALSSGIMLYGLSILFGLTGSTSIYEISAVLSGLGSGASYPITISLLLILVGFGYKIAMVPFHFWTPDVYQGAPTPITAFLSVAPKAAGFAIILRVLGTVFGAQGNVNLHTWTALDGVAFGDLMAIFAAATMTVGNILAIQQDSVKRLLAYSAIAHAGYMLMAVTILNVAALNAIMFYLAVYLFMNLGAFFVAIYAQNLLGTDDINSWKGLGFKTPIVAVPMVIFLFSLTGLPPTAGFVGKIYLFSVLIESQRYWWLAVLGMINSVIALYYYVRIIRMMFLEGDHDAERVSGQTMLTSVILILLIPVLLFGVYWSPLMDFVRESVNTLSVSL